MEVTILQYCDGWEIRVGNRVYRYDHNDEDYGAEALKVMFEDLGYKVELEECY